MEENRHFCRVHEQNADFALGTARGGIHNKRSCLFAVLLRNPQARFRFRAFLAFVYLPLVGTREAGLVALKRQQ